MGYNGKCTVLKDRDVGYWRFCFFFPGWADACSTRYHSQYRDLDQEKISILSHSYTISLYHLLPTLLLNHSQSSRVRAPSIFPSSSYLTLPTRTPSAPHPISNTYPPRQRSDSYNHETPDSLFFIFSKPHDGIGCVQSKNPLLLKLA
jgi:hypothetical protein